MVRASGRDTDPREERGRAIYNYRCYFCHGYSGDAKTLAATYLSPPPRNLRDATPAALDRTRIAEAVRNGRDRTAMRPFAGILRPDEIEAVAVFVEREFVVRKAVNTIYHTRENGWPDHDRYRTAFPFARGEIALDSDWSALSAEERAGKRLYLASCVSCHDRARVASEGVAWETRPLSAPRSEYTGNPDENPDSDEFGPYRLHESVPKIAGLTAAEKRGQALYQSNCAMCHAADGSGRNWIGSFLEPHPPDLTAARSAGVLSRSELIALTRDGLPGTSMPAFGKVLSAPQLGDIERYVRRAFIDPARPAHAPNRTAAR